MTSRARVGVGEHRGGNARRDKRAERRVADPHRGRGDCPAEGRHWRPVLEPEPVTDERHVLAERVYYLILAWVLV